MKHGRKFGSEPCKEVTVKHLEIILKNHERILGNISTCSRLLLNLFSVFHSCSNQVSYKIHHVPSSSIPSKILSLVSHNLLNSLFSRSFFWFLPNLVTDIPIGLRYQALMSQATNPLLNLKIVQIESEILGDSGIEETWDDVGVGSKDRMSKGRILKILQILIKTVFTKVSAFWNSPFRSFGLLG